jgi:hypothetical protein
VLLGSGHTGHSEATAKVGPFQMSPFFEVFSRVHKCRKKNLPTCGQVWAAVNTASAAAATAEQYHCTKLGDKKSVPLPPCSPAPSFLSRLTISPLQISALHAVFG